MPYLQLKLVSESSPEQNNSCRFAQQGGSIGRSNDCDWTLIDAERYISNKHLIISFQNQNFILTDVSSNGVFINNSSSALGKNNNHVLKPSDSIVIGKFSIQVEGLEIAESVAPYSGATDGNEDSGLLGLIMGGDETSTSKNSSESLLDIPQSSAYNAKPIEDEGLGLSDILSSSVSSTSNQNNAPSNEVAHQFDSSGIEPKAYTPPQQAYTPPKAPQHYVANDTSIPEDWELSGIMPVISDYKAPQESVDVIPEEVISSPPTSLTPPTNTVDLPDEVIVVNPQPVDEKVKEIVPEPLAFVAPNIIEEPVIAPQPQVEISNEVFVTENAIKSEQVIIKPSISKEVNKPAEGERKSPVINSQESNSLKNNDDIFLNTLYTKLGLPKEYISSLDPDTFADDIVTILLSTTKGLMSLLNSRTAFKQESRLSVTSVQPRSNNPIKFSIDPVDTLEMLLLKKKKGYMSAKDSYEEAVKDIQLHQMAFLSGLQATLTGVLAQLDPVSIEEQVNEKGRSFMGLNSSAKCWQHYKDKQEVMVKSVNENLNEVLSQYFSEAYQAQINSFKNEK